MTEKINPRAARLEASSFCQLRCPSCPTTTRAIHPHVGSGFLRLDDFKKFVASNPQVRDIELSNYGEIFLNPQLLEIVEHAFEKGVVLRAANGVNLNNARAEVLDAMVRCGFAFLNCSIDGASQATYGKYRVRGNFDTVMANIRTINALKTKYRTDKPLLCWQFVVFGHNEHEIPIARKMARELGMNFAPKLSWDDDYSPIKDPAFVLRETGFPVASRAEWTERFGTSYLQGICHELWDRPQINYDGKVLGCCRNFWGDFGGNAFEDGFVEAVNHEKARYAREMLQGRVPERADIPCTTCEIYLSMKAKGRFLDRSKKR